MPSVCKNLDKAPATEMETPYKACISAIEKKLRNLEKRKGKLDAYREKLTKGEKLDKDQKEAVDKYETVIASMEFAKELQKQFQMMSDEADKLAEKQSKKQAKREKQERQQQEMERLSDVLRLQCLLDSLGTDEVRADLQSGKYTSLTLTEQNLTQLDEFYQLIAPTIDGSETSFSAQLVSSSEHLISYLDRVDKPVVSTTYKELHELIDRIAQSGFFDVSLSSAAAAAASAAVGEAEAQVAEPTAEEELAAETEAATAAPQDEAPEIVSLPAEQTLEAAQTEMEIPTASAIDAMSKSEVGEFEMVSVSDSGSMMQPGSLAGMTWYQQSAAPPAAPANIQARQQRPLQEIVSSLQGNYNFLQDSEIEVAESFDRMNFSAVQDPAAYASYLPPQGVPQTVADLHHYSSSAAAAVVTAAPPTTYPNGSYIAAHHHQVAIQQEPSYVVVGHDPADLQYAAYTAAAATQAGFMPPGVMTLPAAAADVSAMQQQMQQQPKTTLQSVAHESSAKLGAGDTPENLSSAAPSQQQQHAQQQQQHHQTQPHHQQSGAGGQGQHHMPAEQHHQGFDSGHGYGAGHGGYSAGGGPQGGGYGGRGGRGGNAYVAGYSGAARTPNRGGPYGGGQMSSGGRGGGSAGYRGGKSR